MMVSTLLKEIGVALKLNECNFFTSRIDCLGHVIKSGRLEVANYTADTICILKAPKTIIELHEFLRL